ncbi:proline-rich receptor-like protein kinase PERK2 [Penaeus chinensis]|uniref:proline-rich receptor-like protein kinase PERK2 n=1 Tax=Penaeus chinensis TaxID=139456 RepID=UPI001FB6B615|nr:proline-rich receptor-like protein kinase PERK2 [Penaeus chinensis]
MDFSAAQRVWLQTGSLSITLLDRKYGCLLEKDALFKTRVKGGRLIVRKETKPKAKVCEVAVTEVPAPGNQLFVSCVEDKLAATEELGALMAAANITLQNRRIGRTMGGFTPSTSKPSSGLPKTKEIQDEGALTTLESKLPPTISPTEPKPITKKYAPTETVLSTMKIIPTPTVLLTEIKVSHLPTLVATVTVPPLSTVVPSITLTPTTERETVTTPPPSTNAPSTPPPPTAPEAASTPPPSTTTEEPPTTQPPTTSERPTEHPLPAPPETSKPAVTAAATAKSPLLEEDEERFGAKSGTPPSPEPTHENWTKIMLEKHLAYVIGCAVGVFVLILLIIVLVALSKRRKKVNREVPIVLGSANYKRQQDDLDSHDQDHVNILMYSAAEQEEAPPHNDLEERILMPPGGTSSTPATPRCLRDKNFD